MFRKFFETYSELHVLLFINFLLPIPSLYLLLIASLLILFFIGLPIILEIMMAFTLKWETAAVVVAVVVAVFTSATNPAAAGDANTLMACIILLRILLFPAADAVKVSTLIPPPFYNVCNLLHRQLTCAAFGPWRHRDQRGCRNMLLVVVRSGLRHLILDAQSIKRQPLSLPSVVRKVVRKEEAIKKGRYYGGTASTLIIAIASVRRV
mmetsp:Transcript_32327/g.52387  ORF Transcript_32327/g.52387 Transcript_32327/m.52387 type:complete len:208 (+) Transcript_32327:480-1103(+)